MRARKDRYGPLARLGEGLQGGRSPAWLGTSLGMGGGDEEMPPAVFLSAAAAYRARKRA